jgi:hypothetical protein
MGHSLNYNNKIINFNGIGNMQKTRTNLLMNLKNSHLNHVSSFENI